MKLYAIRVHSVHTQKLPPRTPIKKSSQIKLMKMQRGRYYVQFPIQNIQIFNPIQFIIIIDQMQTKGRAREEKREYEGKVKRKRRRDFFIGMNV